MTISSILVANRGEIACRIIRTAKALGLKTVAIYSDADITAKHVRLADHAKHVGSSPVIESYLAIDRIISAALASGADAIHPGYGFLSENAAFATACLKAGLTFIGPPQKAIEIMGDKARAKTAMIAAGVPCIPGYQGEDQTTETLLAAAEDIGLPVMIKAAAGGGGRGMRQVESPEQLENAIKIARAEAKSAFGSDVLIIEKVIPAPRHVEIQILADQHGHIIHLGERDCSVQRRHQKIIEEAPCPVLNPALRREMGEAAIIAAKAVDYCGAGTVEFLLGADGAYYFLEMNTRLQVEHPVTEAITGLDLVALQIGVANGDALPVRQDDVRLNGHAIEIRLYAEDPANGFLPSTGPVDLWMAPTRPGIRVDDGIDTGVEVSPFYDPMLAKIIAHGATRQQAVARLRTALGNTALFGATTNRDFLIDAIERPAFVDGKATTAFIEETYGTDGYRDTTPPVRLLAAAAILDYLDQQDQACQTALAVNHENRNWSSTHDLIAYFDYRCEDTMVNVKVTHTDEQFMAIIDEQALMVNIKYRDQNTAGLVIDGDPYKVIFNNSTHAVQIANQTRSVTLTKLNTLAADAKDNASDGTVSAPMHGRLLEISVAVGDNVKIGDKIAVLEAMKMQHEIVAEIDGTVSTIAASENIQIAADDLILEIERPGGEDQ